MKELLRQLRIAFERWSLQYRIACMEAELQGAREDLDRHADYMAALRRSIELAKQRLNTAGGYRPSDYQLRHP